ncbi:NXPE family member 3-like [Centropristis striata]|uniref:NXPE family member 3-like n=1 Tax=Centropristis striata TaxID=184440 RepID=UPI0027DEFD38|nr:NXPE family member 3-like [Centropristis striata]
MRVRVGLSREYIAIFLFLAVGAFILLLHNMELLEFGQNVNATIPVPRRSKDPDMHRSLCPLQPLSPEDAAEEILLLESIAWPGPPPLPAPLSQTSDPAHSSFTIVPAKGRGQWHVGDQLEVLIKVSDFQGRPKTFGGDFLFARLHNQALVAGVAGQVVDHLNGSYSAFFSLLWEGDAQVEVMLVHPSEAIPVLQRLVSEYPGRMSFRSVFRSGSLSETSYCNICMRPTQQPLCNYTDPLTGEPFFCLKPKSLSCGTRFLQDRWQIDSNRKNVLLQSGVNMKVYIRPSGPASVPVLPKNEGEPEVKSNIVKSGPSGYYYQGVWRALDGTTVHQFNSASVIVECLKGKELRMYGDSTVNQWFKYLLKAHPGLKMFNLHTEMKAGPFMALDYANNILMFEHCHGPPLHYGPFLTRSFRYIANELDGLTGGTNTVVVIGVWAHFVTYPMEIYIRRLQNIRRAVVRLLDRSPDTLVIIRTANPKDVQETPMLSDWSALQRDKVLRAMFKGLNVRWVDAWDMVLAHYLPHLLHPGPPIIKNMVDVLLSHMCPTMGS